MGILGPRPSGTYVLMRETQTRKMQSSTVRKSQLVQWRKELVRVDREDFPEGTEV